MRQLFLINFGHEKTFVTLFTILSCLTSSVGHSKGDNYKDIVWNITFCDNAGFPSTGGDKQNFRWIEENKKRFLRFSLHNKQVGESTSDNKKRNGAPFWERVIDLLF